MQGVFGKREQYKQSSSRITNPAHRSERCMSVKHLFFMLVIVFTIGLCPYGGAETFLITSDLHLTSDISAHETTLNALRDAAQDVDAVILLGDSTNNTRMEEHVHVLEFLSSLSKPAYVIPGNHDMTLDISDFIGLYADYGWNLAFSRDRDSASCAVMTDNGTCLLLLDTNHLPGRVASRGGISDSTCEWVSSTLSSLPDEAPVVACGHHPLLPEERWRGTPGAEALVNTLQGVKLYLCGHDHGFAAVKVDEMQQITVGQPQAYPGWAGILEISEDSYRWQVLSLYDAQTLRAMRSNSMTFAENMAKGTLAGTIHEGDEGAIQWFAKAFEAATTSQLTEIFAAEMLDTPDAQKWREIETKTVVKKWLFGLLEDPPNDVRQIEIAIKQTTTKQ